MPEKKKPDPNEKPQKQRFIEAARKAGVDVEKMEREIVKIAPPKKPKR